MGNPGLNFLIRQIQLVVIFLRVICAIRGSISFIFSLWSLPALSRVEGCPLWPQNPTNKSKKLLPKKLDFY